MSPDGVERIVQVELRSRLVSWRSRMWTDGLTPAYSRAVDESNHGEAQLTPVVVGGFHVGDGRDGQAAAGASDLDPLSTAVERIWCPHHQAAGRELADYLAGHHRVVAGVLGELGLRGGLVVVCDDPRKGSEQDELDVGADIDTGATVTGPGVVVARSAYEM